MAGLKDPPTPASPASAPRLALAVAAFVAVVWLNQGISVAGWEARTAHPAADVLDAVRRPLLFLYRRAPDEEMYFTTASAVLGRPYDVSVFTQRGDTPLPPVTTPADGKLHVPYAEIPFEYPPPNVPFVVLPRLLAGTFEGYARLLGAILGLALAVAAAIGARLATTVPRERAARLFAFALLLLAHGAIAIQRLDALVALLLVAVVALVDRRRDFAAGFAAGLVAATKFVPALACAAIFAADGMAREPRRLLRTSGGVAVGLAAGLGPMLVLAPGSLADVLRYHAARGLHVESSLGVVYGAAKAVAGHAERTVLDFGSFNFHGPLADALAGASTLLTLGLVAVVLVPALRARPPAEARHTADTERTARLVLAAFAATVALWLGGKVFSPQYLTWALPLAVAVPGRSWTKLALLFGGVLLLSQLYYRGYYDYVYAQRALGVVTMVVRLGLLVALFETLRRAFVRALNAPPDPS